MIYGGPEGEVESDQMIAELWRWEVQKRGVTWRSCHNKGHKEKERKVCAFGVPVSDAIHYLCHFLVYNVGSVWVFMNHYFV